MFKLYVTNGLSIPSSSDTYVYVDHKSNDGKVFRLGSTIITKSVPNPIWDLKHENPFFYPFVDTDNCLVEFSVLAKGLFHSSIIGKASISLNTIQYDKKIELDLETDSKPKNGIPKLVIFVNIIFNSDIALTKDKEALKLKQNNFLFIYIESPRTQGGSESELQIYECNSIDGGYSRLIEKKSPKGDKIKKLTFSYPITNNGGNQIFLFNINQTKPKYRYIPLVLVKYHPDHYINENEPLTLFFNIALYSFADYPALEQGKDGTLNFDQKVRHSFYPVLVHQDSIECHEIGWYSYKCCLFFNDGELRMHPIQTFAQPVGNPEIFETYALRLRTAVLPKGIKAFRRFLLDPSNLLTFKKIADFHGIKMPSDVHVCLKWKKEADLDLSLCALNKNMDCIGHVSFKDRSFFQNDALQHTGPFRDENPIKGGAEDVIIRLDFIPKQVKIILIVVTSYTKVPFAELKPIFQIIDSIGKLELLFYKLETDQKSPGLVFAALHRMSRGQWYFVPIFKFYEENKPYSAHRIAKDELKTSNYIADFISHHQTE